ncbi:MAG: hypothetical protein H0S78_11310, partial [Tissierellales bacterium]|nr:hypothetical protein [Tissierellales bacterium]
MIKNFNKYHNLFKFIPYFEKKENLFYKLIPSYEDGINVMGWIQYSEEVNEFIKEFYKSDLVEYNYLEVLEKFESIENIESRIELESLDIIKALLTFYIRRERFGEGYISDAIDYGLILRI